ncbi:PKD domain-containing protein [Parvicella tangerina]|uniref:PKD domain-containing protein n=1 Tax=Parvicella tangerina TaxID=2829795 RepID=A0A916JNQ2_9FLAO|nr:PKD domain-containing protein [Parvicella tangerina]CAG5082518.1 hypothetical protein CRYO30217_01939 [Parvicella tangerina]
MRKLFTLLLLYGFTPYIAQQNIAGYRYWFDDDFTNVQETNISPVATFQLNTAIDANHLNDGLHVLNIQFSDENGVFSSVLSRFVTKNTPSSVADVKITAWEYWFDLDHSSATISSVPATDVLDVSTTINGSSLSNGLHIINFRFQDNKGNWSSVLSRFVTKAPSTLSVSNHITEWEYWFDEDYGNVTSSSIAPTNVAQLTTMVDASSLNNGLHVLNIRFKDEREQWSSVLSRFVTKTNEQLIVSNKISEWEYWFDEDYQSMTATPVTPNAAVQINDLVSGNGLTNGLHILHLRFKDELGQYSSVLSRFVIKSIVEPATPNLITSYRYWFNDGDSAMIIQHLPSPTSVYHLTVPIAMSHLPKGDYQVNFQFKDTLQHWSSVLSDSVYKNSLPVALFDGDTLNFCDSALVQFNDGSIDANQWFWTFGDGGSSTAQNPDHQYSSAGFYDVALTVTDTISGLDSTVTVVSYINSFATPNPAITAIDNDSICFGSETRLMVDENANILWSTSETNDTITAAAEGWHFVNLSNANYNVCSAEDSIYITEMPMLTVDLGNDTAICDGNSLDLSAPAATSWLWSTTATTQDISVSTAGFYFVDIFDELGCSSRDSIEVGINPLAIADFSYTASIGDIDFTSLSTDAIDFSWVFDDGNTSSIENPSNSYLQDGTYHVCLTVSNDCNTDVYCEDIVIQGIGIDDLSSAPLMALYPNPVIDEANLIISGNASEVYQVRIFSATGQLVHQEQVKGNSTQLIRLASLVPGNYILQVSSEKSRSSLKFVKL